LRREEIYRAKRNAEDEEVKEKKVAKSERSSQRRLREADLYM